MDADSLCGYLGIPNADHRATGWAAQKIERAEEAESQYRQAYEIERDRRAEIEAEKCRTRHGHAAKSPCQGFQMLDRIFDDERKRDRCDYEIKAGHSHRRQADARAD